MEKKKNVFGDIKSMLTRDQMKQIKGGSGDIGQCRATTGCGGGYLCVDSRGYCSSCCVA